MALLHALFCAPAETIDLSSAAKIIDKLKPVDILKKVYSLDCHYDPDKSVQAYISTTPDDNGQFSGNVSIKMFSKVRSEDHYAYRNSTDPELTEFLLYDQVSIQMTLTSSSANYNCLFEISNKKRSTKNNFKLSVNFKINCYFA